MKKSIKGKLLIVFLLIFTVLATNSIWAIINFNRLNNSIDNIMESNYRTIDAAQNMIVALERQDSAILAQMFIEDESAEKTYIENEKVFLKWLARAEDNITEVGEAEILASINSQYFQYLEMYNTLTQILSYNDPKLVREFYYNEILPQFESTKEECRNLEGLNQNAMLARRDSAKAIGKRASYSTILLSVITIVIGMILALYITNKIIKPIYNLIQKIKGIAEGDYSQQLDIEGDDEIGELAREFNSMTEKLESYDDLNIKKLMKEKQKAEAIVESISDGIIVTDEFNRVILVNRAAEKALNIREKDVVNRHFLENIKREDIFKIINKIRTSEDQYAYKKYTNITIANDEKIRHYRINVRAITDREGDNVGVITLLQDITKLKEIDEMKSEFVSTVSHEFRTPLTSISMAAGLLLDKTSGEINENQAELLEAIVEDNERLKNLVSDLLDLSRLEAGKVSMDIELQDINEMIEYAIKQFRRRAKERNINLEIQVKGDISKVKADFNKISWVITNLVGNAIRYTPRDGSGKIIVKAQETANKVLVSVADNGRGIPEEYHDRIFSKFIQVKDDEDNGEKGGTGLGLAISKEIINAHGGEIWVDSKVGEGSTFYFTIYIGTQ